MKILFLNKNIYLTFITAILIFKNIYSNEFDNNYNHYNGNQIKYFKVFGERCSGTNFLSRLVRTNVPELSKKRSFGHKHFLCWFDFPIDLSFMKSAGYQESFYTLEDSEEFLFLVIVRDPYDWVRSFYKTPWGVPDEIKNFGFSHFIRSVWKN